LRKTARCPAQTSPPPPPSPPSSNWIIQQVEDKECGSPEIHEELDLALDLALTCKAVR